MLEAGREQGWTLVPTFSAGHPPVTGTLTAEAFGAIRTNLAEAVDAARHTRRRRLVKRPPRAAQRG